MHSWNAHTPTQRLITALVALTSSDRATLATAEHGGVSINM
jgi:hypothetical protein